MADAQMLFREWQMRHSDGKSQSFKHKQVNYSVFVWQQYIVIITAVASPKWMTLFADACKVHCVPKKRPPFIFLITLSKINRF